MDMPKQLCIRLPLLHPRGGRTEPWAMRLSCGAGDGGEGFFCPDYPMTGAEAQSFLAGLRGLDARDLEGMRLAASRGLMARQVRKADEMAALASFSQSGSAGDSQQSAWKAMLEHAQQLLLWCWLLEEKALEIAAMEARCQEAGQSLLNGLWERPEPAAAQSVALDDRLLPPWRVCLANALLFLPGDAHILAEGALAEELAGRLEMRPCREVAGAEPYPGDMLAVRAPLWLVLGHTGPGSAAAGPLAPLLTQIYDCPRIWLARSENGA